MENSILRAHYDTMIEWGDLYAHDGREGTMEVAFLLRRAAIKIAKIADLKVTNLPPEPKAAEPGVEDMRDG